MRMVGFILFGMVVGVLLLAGQLVAALLLLVLAVLLGLYVKPPSQLHGQDMLSREKAPPEPEGRTGPVVIQDVSD